MRLRTKLLLGVGILLLSMLITMYILPTYFVRQDVYKAADEIHELLVEDHKELIRSQEVWISDVLSKIKQNINSLLYMIYEEPNFSSQMTFKKNSNADVWNALARLAGYDPGIGFLQAHSPEMKKTAVILPHAAEIYTIDRFLTKENHAILTIRGSDENQEPLPFLGLPLPEELQTEPGYTLYALVNPMQASEQIKEVQSEFKDLTPEEIKKQLLEAKVIDSSVSQQESAFIWAIKIYLIRALTPLFLEGLTIGVDQKVFVPEGIARVDSTHNGYAILSDNVFSLTPLFDDKLYYEKHQPSSITPPLADGNAIIEQLNGDHVYIGNTLLLDSTFITIAYQLSSLAKQLALSSHKLILLRVNKNFWIGFDGNGDKASRETIDGILKTGLIDQKQGMLSFDDNSYFYERISSLENGNVVFYDLRSTKRQKSIIGTLLSLEESLSNRISTQLSLIALATIILVLIFIGRIGYTVIYPVTQLAQATQHVVAGRYQEIQLPDVGHRQDEVATLTRSFAEMVKGLQEREKIRGVLDKVVSKDVADEILRTQIHLGGEDRVVSMFFSDIRGFTGLTEHLTPQKTIEMLNSCMTKISRVIEGEGGVIDKYVGDEVMAIFGAPTTHPDHALRAVSTGMLVIETLKKWNQERIAANEPPIEMGIGVHTGLVVAGNMGAEDRLNYTVLGANVNLAARLCEAAKPNQLIISESTLAQPNVEASFYTRPLEPISFKGFSEPVQSYEIVGFKWEEA